jgi:ribonuclease HII
METVSCMAAPGRALLAYDRTRGRLVAGADEAGKACLAGPLVAAAVCLDFDRIDPEAELALARLNDSKKLSKTRCLQLREVVLELAARTSIIVVSAAEIDRDGIHPSQLGALAKVLEAVCPADALLVDHFRLPALRLAHESITRGDSTSAAIACASILAKTEHDRLMQEADSIYPGYGFATNFGYSRPEHREAIRTLGPTPLHRRSFRLPTSG